MSVPDLWQSGFSTPGSRTLSSRSKRQGNRSDQWSRNGSAQWSRKWSALAFLILAASTMAYGTSTAPNQGAPSLIQSMSAAPNAGRPTIASLECVAFRSTLLDARRDSTAIPVAMLGGSRPSEISRETETPVLLPEPTSVSLLGWGLLLLASRRGFSSFRSLRKFLP